MHVHVTYKFTSCVGHAAARQLGLRVTDVSLFIDQRIYSIANC